VELREIVVVHLGGSGVLNLSAVACTRRRLMPHLVMRADTGSTGKAFVLAEELTPGAVR